jgi:hypothetical protein
VLRQRIVELTAMVEKMQQELRAQEAAEQAAAQAAKAPAEAAKAPARRESTPADAGEGTEARESAERCAAAVRRCREGAGQETAPAVERTRPAANAEVDAPRRSEPPACPVVVGAELAAHRRHRRLAARDRRPTPVEAPARINAGRALANRVDSAFEVFVPAPQPRPPDLPSPAARSLRR